jgi:hypothetical protein
MITLPIYASDRTPTLFDVSSFRGDENNPVTDFDFTSRGVIRITANAGETTLDSDLDPDSIWFEGNQVHIRFADLNLPQNQQYTLNLSAYQFENPEPTVMAGPYTYTRIVLVSLLEQ